MHLLTGNRFTPSPHQARAAVAVLIVLAVPFVFFGPVLSREDRTLPWDFVGFHLPLLAIKREAWLAGKFPFWDVYNYCGRPFAANPQTEAFYPPTWLTVALAPDSQRLLGNFEFAVVAHISAGALFALLLARRLGCRWIASTFAGVSFGGGCFFASQVQHVGAIEGGAWLPAVWWAVAGLARQPSARAAVLLAALLATATLTGFTPGLLIVYLSSGLLCAALTRVWRTPVRTVFVWWCGGVLLSVVLAAIQLLPTVELATHSIGKFRLEWRGTGGGIPWEAFVTLVAPNYYGISDPAQFRLPYEITSSFLFCGLAALLLVVCGFYLAVRDVMLRSFAVLIVLTGILMLGDRTWAGLGVWHTLPTYIRASYYPTYWMMAFSLAVALSAALALDRIRIASVWKTPLILVAAFELIWTSSGLPMNSQRYESGDRVEERSFHGDTRTPAVLAGARFDVTDESDHWVINAPLLRLPTANGYDPLALERMIQARLFLAKGNRWGALYKVEQPQSPMLEMLNVDALLARRPILSEQWQPRQTDPQLVYRRTTPSQRAFFASSVTRVENMGAAVQALQTPKWVPREHAVIESPDEDLTSGPGEVQVLSWKTGEIRLRTANTRRSLLIISEAYFPGWTAVVEKQEAPVWPVNVAFQGVWVPAGTHDVTLNYSPRIFVIGLAISAVGLAISFWAYLQSRARQ